MSQTANRERVGKNQSPWSMLNSLSFRNGVKLLRNLLFICGATVPDTSRFLPPVGMTKHQGGFFFWQ